MQRTSKLAYLYRCIGFSDWSFLCSLQNNINWPCIFKIWIWSGREPPKRSRFPHLFSSQGNLSSKPQPSDHIKQKRKHFLSVIHFVHLSCPCNLSYSKVSQVSLDSNHLPRISSYLCREVDNIPIISVRVS